MKKTFLGSGSSGPRTGRGSARLSTAAQDQTPAQGDHVGPRGRGPGGPMGRGGRMGGPMGAASRSEK